MGKDVIVARDGIGASAARDYVLTGTAGDDVRATDGDTDEPDDIQPRQVSAVGPIIRST